jgi:hypothetical protein
MNPIIRQLILKRFRSIPAETVTFDNPTFLRYMGDCPRCRFVHYR